MTKYILALCAICVLTGCSGSAKASYDVEGDWMYEGYDRSEKKELSNVEVSPNGDGTYTVDKGGCVA